MGAQDAVFQVFQLLGNVALPARQGLLSDVVPRHLVFIAVGHLYVVAEHTVIPCFQLGDTGPFTLPGFHRGNQLPAAVHVPLDLVQLRIIAFPDDAALPDGKGRVVHNGGIDPLGQVPQAIDVLVDLLQKGGLAGSQRLLQTRKPFQRRREGTQLPPVGRTVDDAGHDALQVVNAGKLLGELIQHLRVVKQLRHSVLPPGDPGRAQERLLQPGLDQTLAHGCFRPVQHPEKRALFLLVAQGFGQLQVPPGVDIQPHHTGVGADIHLIHPLQAGDLGAGKVIEQRTQSLHSQGLVRKLQLGKALPAKLAANRLLGAFQIVVQGWILALHRSVELVPDEIGQAGKTEGLGVQQDLTGAVTGQAVLQNVEEGFHILG